MAAYCIMYHMAKKLKLQDSVYKLRVELLETTLPIWREIAVPATIRLSELHDVLQLVMGWQDCHLHEFEVGKRRFSSNQQLDEDCFDMNPVEQSRSIRLCSQLVRPRSTMVYTYDYGDNWQHRITLLAICSAQQQQLGLLGGEGACPLEDCGGPYGHDKVCHHLSMSLHMRRQNDHADLEGWIPEDYDPRHFDLARHHALLLDYLRTKKYLGAADKIQKTPPAVQKFQPDDDIYDMLELFPEPYEDLSADEYDAYANLFAAAAEVRQLEPWEHLYDRDLIGIENPATKAIDLLTVLGAGRDVYGVQLHQGPQGYVFWQSLYEDAGFAEIIPEDHIYAIDVEFCNRARMEKPDLRLYRLSDRRQPKAGERRMYCKFRQYHPRSSEWFLASSKVAELERALRLCTRFVTLLKDTAVHQQLLAYVRRESHELPAEIPVFRLPEGADAEDPAAWQLAFAPVPWLDRLPSPVAHVPTEFDIESLRQIPLIQEEWEVGAFFMPEHTVMTRSGPVIPIMALVLEIDKHRPGELFSRVSADLEQTPAHALWQAFMAGVRARGGRPTRVHVSSQHAADTFSHAAMAIGLGVIQRDNAQFIHHIFRQIEEDLPF